MIQLNQAIARIQDSPTLALTAKAKQLKAQGEDVVAFTAGEPDLDTPDHIKNAAKDALDKGLTRYTAVIGIDELRKKLADKYNAAYGLDYTAKNVIITNGGKQSLSELFAVTLEPGDEVIIPAPYWASYPDMAMLIGAEPVIIETTASEGYILSPEALKNACSDRTKAIIINSPSNPTGSVYSAAALKAIAKTIKSLPNAESIMVVSDEVYEHTIFGGGVHRSILQEAPELLEQTVISSAFSKTYSMTGWRVGYAIGPVDVIAAMSKYQSQTTSNVCSIAQYAAASAFDDNLAFPKLLSSEFEKRLGILLSELETIPGLELPVKPQGAFYAFVRVEGLFGKSAGGKKISSASDFADYLLEEYKVVVVPGEAFGDSGAMRLSIAVSEDSLRKGLSRVREAVSKLS
ncbi:MAG: pyridoxal phosphate-dependent aminotransferase [Bdellovibrionales bacterium]|nr:pyridoxal phosphate-dependent aminotransferase [Bdellovibrionales bacterium]